MDIRRIFRMGIISENTTVKITLGVVVILLVFIISASFTVASWKGDLEHQVKANAEKIETHDDDICDDLSYLMSRDREVDARLSGQDIKLTEIQTDVKWIRVAIEELKE